MNDQCPHCRNGYLGGQSGADVECVNGVLIDIDTAREGWRRDVIYPPAPCVASQWDGGESDGWFDECQRRLSAWRGDDQKRPESTIELLTQERDDARAALQSERDKAAKKEAERQRFREIVAEGIREAREKKAAHD